jgi:hypothetical protein
VTVLVGKGGGDGAGHAWMMQVHWQGGQALEGDGGEAGAGGGHTTQGREVQGWGRLQFGWEVV